MPKVKLPESRDLMKCSDSLQTSRSPAQYSAARTFTTTSRFKAELPGSSATTASSIPSVTPPAAEGGPSTGLKAAKGLQKVAGRGSLETYTAYGVTEALAKDCAVQADYSIPQAQDEDADMPKTDDGEDLGIGSGWWHTGKLSVHIYKMSCKGNEKRDD